MVAIGFGLALLLLQLGPDGLREVLGLGLASETLLVPLSLLFLAGQLACTDWLMGSDGSERAPKGHHSDCVELSETSGRFS